MISETSTIIVIHPKSKTIKKKIFLTLKRETKFEDFKSEIIKQFQIKDEIERLDIFVQFHGKQIALTSQNFQQYKSTSHINKIVKLREYEWKHIVLNQMRIFQNNIYHKNTSLQQLKYIKIENKNIFQQYSSFFADDFHQIREILENICPLKENKQLATIQQQQCLKYIQKILSFKNKGQQIISQ